MIKAIETSYKGHRFRSRLEARWAVVFDALGIRWQYEAQGYEVGHRVSLESERTWGYLPDFWLPDLSLFVEVKGSLTEPEHLRFMDAAASLCDRTDARTMLVGTVPADPVLPAAYSMRKGCALVSPALIPGTVDDGLWAPEHGSRADGHALAVCVAHDVGGDWRRVTSERCASFPSPSAPPSPMPDQGYPHQTWARAAMEISQGHARAVALYESIAAAYRAGRRARFEHGETPK